MEGFLFPLAPPFHFSLERTSFPDFFPPFFLCVPDPHLRATLHRPTDRRGMEDDCEAASTAVVGLGGAKEVKEKKKKRSQGRVARLARESGAGVLGNAGGSAGRWGEWRELSGRSRDVVGEWFADLIVLLARFFLSFFFKCSLRVLCP